MNIRKYYGYMLLAIAASLSANCCRFEVDSLKADLLEIKELVGLMVETPALDGFISGALDGDAEVIKAALQDAVACVAAAKDVLTDEQIVAYANKLEAYWAELGEARAPRPPFVDPAEGQLAPNELTYFPRDVFIARDLEVGGTLTVDGGININAGTVVFTDTTNSADFNCFDFKKSRNNGIVQNGDSIGCINFSGYDGSKFVSGAMFEANVDGAPGLGDMPGRMSFLTTPDGSSVPIERMSVNNAGVVALANNLEIGNTTSATVGIISQGGVPLMENPGTSNTFFGINAGNLTLSGVENSAIGKNAAPVISTASQTIAVGKDAALNLVTGTVNTYVGRGAGSAETVGSDNIAVGTFALGGSANYNRNTVIGGAAFTLGSSAFARNDNVAIGYHAALTMGNAPAGTAQNNVLIGSGVATSLLGAPYVNMTQVSRSTMIGAGAGSSVTSGLFEITCAGAGSLAGSSQTTCIGALANANFGGGSAFGFQAVAPAAVNQIRIGNTAITVIQGQVAFTFPSDERIKSNIVETPFGLAFIKNIRPIMYDKQCGENSVTELGFSAQNVEQEAEDIGVVFPGISYSESEDLYSMRYNDLFAPVVKAIQELSEEIMSLKARRDALRASLSH